MFTTGTNRTLEATTGRVTMKRLGLSALVIGMLAVPALADDHGERNHPTLKIPENCILKDANGDVVQGRSCEINFGAPGTINDMLQDIHHNTSAIMGYDRQNPDGTTTHVPGILENVGQNRNDIDDNKTDIGDWTAGTERDTNETSVKDAIQDLEEKAGDTFGNWTEGSERDDNETSVKEAIENEERDRKDADTVLQTNIDNEATARADADAAEATARKAADDAEATARKAADAAEAATREAADTALGGRIDTETTERKAADAAEATAREAADTALGARITNEAAASRARDDALGKRIDENSEAIEDAIALSAAIPDSWLSDSENFALALGGGFTDGSSAFGGIGTFRISKNLSAYGGGSTLTNGGTWAAKGGIRLGW